jgi:hypothetical protein
MDRRRNVATGQNSESPCANILLLKMFRVQIWGSRGKREDCGGGDASSKRAPQRERNGILVILGFDED